MAKSGSTPIEFPAKAFLVAGLLAWLVAIVTVIAVLSAHKNIYLITAVFWVIISILCIRSWLAKK
jgi:hypothetical protein